MVVAGLLDLIEARESARRLSPEVPRVMTSLDRSTPSCSEPRNLRNVVLGVEVISTKLLSGKTTSGTNTTAVRRM